MKDLHEYTYEAGWQPEVLDGLLLHLLAEARLRWPAIFIGRNGTYSPLFFGLNLENARLYVDRTRRWAVLRGDGDRIRVVDLQHDTEAHASRLAAEVWPHDYHRSVAHE